MKTLTKIEIKETDNEIFIDILENDYNIIKGTIYDNDLSHQIFELIEQAKNEENRLEDARRFARAQKRLAELRPKDEKQRAYFDGIIATLEILNGYSSIDENFYI